MRSKPPIRKPSYQTYLRQYENKRLALAKKGYSMNERILTQREFMDTYDAVKQDMIAEGKKPANITRQIVTSQAYEVGYKQAMAAYRAYKEIGDPQKLLDIQTGVVPVGELYDISSQYYHELRKSGMSAKEAQQYVSIEIWGS